MSDSLREQIDRIGVKMRMVKERNERLMARNAQLEEELTEANARILALTAESQKMATQIEYYRVASAVAPDAEARAQAREMLEEMIADIDKCIRQLDS